MDEGKVTDLMLLKLFRKCSHLQHRMGRFHGQGYILILLRQHETMTERELAEITQRRPATLSEQLEIMGKAGLITREKNNEDRRNVDIRITDKGWQTALEAEREREEIASVLFSGLDTEERVRLYQTLQKLSTLWQEVNVPDQPEDKC